MTTANRTDASAIGHGIEKNSTKRTATKWSIERQAARQNEGDDVVGHVGVQALVRLHQLDVVEGVGVPSGDELHHAVQAAL